MEARKEDLFKTKKSYSNTISFLKKFFTFLQENGVEILEESFFDEDRTEIATKFLEKVESSYVTKGHMHKIKKTVEDFVKYCVEEHSLITYDELRKENANKMLQVLSVKFKALPKALPRQKVLSHLFNPNFSCSPVHLNF